MMNNQGASAAYLPRFRMKPSNSDIEGIFEPPVVLRNSKLAEK
jgi:hypothetical protein